MLDVMYYNIVDTKALSRNQIENTKLKGRLPLWGLEPNGQTKAQTPYGEKQRLPNKNPYGDFEPKWAPQKATKLP